MENTGQEPFNKDEIAEDGAIKPVKGILSGPKDRSTHNRERPVPSDRDGLRTDKVEVFRMALDVTMLALRDERNRRWFDVSLYDLNEIKAAA